MTEEFEFHGISSLEHDPDLANALGQMLVAWAAVESSLMMVLSCILDADLNQIEPAYYRIPTFEARTKFIRALLLEWETKEYDREAISKAIDKVASLSVTRNGWVHGVWCIREGGTVILDFRAKLDSPDRCRPVKAADVLNHIGAVKERTKQIEALIAPWLAKYFGSSLDRARPPKPQHRSVPAILLDLLLPFHR